VSNAHTRRRVSERSRIDPRQTDVAAVRTRAQFSEGLSAVHFRRRSRDVWPPSPHPAVRAARPRASKNEADNREPDQSHGHLGEDGWRERSRTPRGAPAPRPRVPGRGRVACGATKWVATVRGKRWTISRLKSHAHGLACPSREREVAQPDAVTLLTSRPAVRTPVATSREVHGRHDPEI
jgi:hypothetical protein